MASSGERRIGTVGHVRRDIVKGLGDPATFWSVCGVGLLGSGVARLTGSWSWLANLAALLVTAAVYVLVVRPDDPDQPRLVTRVGRALTRRPG